MHPDVSGLERITYSTVFDGFPKSSYDGMYLVFAFSREQAKEAHETNVFLAEWKE